MTAFGRADERDQMHMLTQRVNSQWGLGVPQTIDRDELEWMLDYPRPGGVSVVVLDMEQQRLTHERVDDGVVSLINDLHKGRHAGLEWRLLVDAVAVVCLLFAFTGIILLVAHATKRRSTWPLVLLGALAPLGCYGLFVP